VQQNARVQAIKRLEKRAQSEKQSQLFIETPYRNMNMLEDILNNCQPKTQLCIACDITLESEYIKTKSIAAWKKEKRPDLNRRPCLFLIY